MGDYSPFIPGTTDVTEYTKKVQFLAKVWPAEHLALLAPRMALLCEGTAFKKVSLLAPDKLRATDGSGVELLVKTLGGSWGLSQAETKYDTFEKALYSTQQKADESNDSYLARHDVHFEELKAQQTTFEEIRAYVLLRQSGLSAEDRKNIVIECGGTLDYNRICQAVRLLGSRVFGDLQGPKSGHRSKVYDANHVDDHEEIEKEPNMAAMMASSYEAPEPELDNDFIEAMVAVSDADALQVQGFEDELENFFQETPELQEALVSYLEARSRLLAKKRNRGFWVYKLKLLIRQGWQGSLP